MKVESINRVLTVIAEDIIELVQVVLASDEVGRNIKVGKNMLLDSALHNLRIKIKPWTYKN